MRNGDFHQPERLSRSFEDHGAHGMEPLGMNTRLAPSNNPASRRDGAADLALAPGLRLPVRIRLSRTMAFLAGTVIVSATSHADTTGALGALPDEFEIPADAPVSSPPPRATTRTSAAAGWGRNRSVVAFDLGMGSAVGFLGPTYAFSPLPFLSTEVGVGLGITGAQYSLMQKLAIGRVQSTIRFSSGVGVSYASGSTGAPDPSVWLNLDLAGLEVRAASHFVFFLSGGVTIGLAGGKLDDHVMGGDDCSPYPDCKYTAKVRGFFAPQFRLGLGRWF
jgi:hypothetical protein